MTEKQIRQRIKVIKDQLTLATQYKEDFLERLGYQGYEDFVNSCLEELKELLEILKNNN